MKSHRIMGTEATTRFILAGNARFTVLNTGTGNRITYRVKRMPERPGRDAGWFVSVLTGSNNDGDYSYLGCIWEDPQGGAPRYYHGRNSRIGRDAMSAKAFEWIARRLFGTGYLPSGIEVWHEGRCGRCGRALTVPESIATGLGPVCASAA